VKLFAAGAVLLAAVTSPRSTPGVQQPASRTTKDGIFTAEQAKRGEILYQTVCATCHGAALTGVEAAPPLTGASFAASWDGAALGDLFDRIRISMPQDKPGTVSRQQTADLVAYILSFNKAPAGKIELPPEIEVLKAIKIVPAQ
jgi:S-disulfanyl-L-cysteine oxidoreductase SoxD